MSKTPYEIRAEMLLLAKDYLDNRHKANVDYANSLQKTGSARPEHLGDFYKIYSMDELFKYAAQMYDFVSTKK